MPAIYCKLETQIQVSNAIVTIRYARLYVLDTLMLNKTIRKLSCPLLYQLPIVNPYNEFSILLLFCTTTFHYTSISITGRRNRVHHL